MNDAVTWAAAVIAIGTGISLIGFWTRYSDRVTKAEISAKEARDDADLARKDAKEAHERISLLDAAFGLYRERVAHEYIHRETMREVEDRLTKAIDRLGDRLDGIASRASKTD